MDLSTILTILSSLGLLSLLRPSINLLKWFYITFFRETKYLKNYGSWAVVTGSSDGIGKAVAFELAHAGLHLVLVGRSPNKLEEVSDAILSTMGSIRIKIIVLDFIGDVSDGVRRLEEGIEGLDVGVMVNCVGATYPSAMYFDEVGERVWKEVVKVNMEATTLVAMAVLKGMVERGSGAMVFIGSGSSVVLPSFPLYAVYAASKAYIDQLSRSLYVEYKEQGIDVQCQIPLYVATKMVPFVKPSVFTPSPKDYARAAVRWIGKEPRCAPYWSHSIQWYLVGLLPDFVLNTWLLRVGISRRTQTKYSMMK